MPSASLILVGKFRDITDRLVAALRKQREIEAQRVLRRYRHLLAPPQETLHLHEVVPVSHEGDISENAYGSDACERAASRPAFERA